MIYLLIKNDDFLFQSYFKNLLKKISPLDERDFNFDHFLAKEHNLQNIISAYQTPPMMAQKRTIIVENFEKLKKEELDAFAKILKTPNDFCYLIFIGEKLDKRTSFFKTLKPHATIEEFQKPYANQIPQLLAKQAQELDLELAPGCAEILVESMGTDLMTLASELEKLKLFVAPRKKITQEETLAILAGGILENVFDLTEAIGQKNLRRSYKLFERFHEQGEPLIKTVSLVISHFRKILITKEALTQSQSASLASLLGVHPYFVKNYQSQAKRFDLKTLKTIYAELMTLSQNLRSSSLAGITLFENFLQKACL